MMNSESLSKCSMPYFSSLGIEAEYMIVEKNHLNPLPYTEKILSDVDPSLPDEIEMGDVAWSNELTAHIIEVKCNGPKKYETLFHEQQAFHQSILQINSILEKYSAKLLPTAMHPTMDPNRDTVLWPYGSKEIYSAYDRIFSCNGHGWANLQSMHINIPYQSEEEFVRLYDALRIVLPLIPFMSASSPFVEGKLGTKPSNRLTFYESNQAKIPSITGLVIPDSLKSFRDYQDLCQKMFDDILPYDPEKILAHRWLNSRGFIAKFDLGAIEIRVMDIQECPYMDFCLVVFFMEVTKALIGEKFSSMKDQNQLTTLKLKKLFDQSNSYDLNLIEEAEYLNLFGIYKPVHFQELCEIIYKKVKHSIAQEWHAGLEHILYSGNLAKRIRKNYPQKDIEEIYQSLAECLIKNNFLA